MSNIHVVKWGIRIACRDEREAIERLCVDSTIHFIEWEDERGVHCMTSWDYLDKVLDEV